MSKRRLVPKVLTAVTFAAAGCSPSSNMDAGSGGGGNGGGVSVGGGSAAGGGGSATGGGGGMSTGGGAGGGGGSATGGGSGGSGGGGSATGGGGGGANPYDDGGCPSYCLLDGGGCALPADFPPGYLDGGLAFIAMDVCACTPNDVVFCYDETSARCISWDCFPGKDTDGGLLYMSDGGVECLC